MITNDLPTRLDMDTPAEPSNGPVAGGSLAASDCSPTNHMKTTYCIKARKQTFHNGKVRDRRHDEIKFARFANREEQRSFRKHLERDHWIVESWAEDQNGKEVNSPHTDQA